MSGHSKQDPFFSWGERSFDLACQRATVGLDPSDQRELDAQVSADELDELDRVMASIHLAEMNVVAPPARAMERLHRSARGQSSAPSSDARGLSLAFVGGMLAAAAIALLLFSNFGRPEPASVDEQRMTLVAKAIDLLEIPWVSNEEQLADPVEGEVVWSRERQEGYMRFSGLVPNDPEEGQFQLWVFDKKRHRWDEHPVDGGVFDVPPGGEVVVPIRVRVPVDEAVLFAITVEKPGGVVVSQRERLILTATL